MKDKKSIIIVALSAVLLFGLSLWCWFKPHTAFSDSERRVLAEAPKLTAENVFSGTFMSEFDSYTVDQFPCRDIYRGMKSAAELYVFGKLDVNGLYREDGYTGKKEYPLEPKMLDAAGEKFMYIYDTYLKDSGSKVYLSVVPDKNYFLAEGNIRLSVDAKEMAEGMRKQAEYMEYIDIIDLLETDDYYLTDTHWRQERITDVAGRLCEGMGAEFKGDFTEQELDSPFRGVYYGQLALPVKTDDLKWLTSDDTESCTVSIYGTGKGKTVPLYDMEKAVGRDPYEMFAGGSDPLVVIENPAAEKTRELIIFRDSFGSSIAPLLTGSYSKITLVDTRYIQSSALGSFVDFNGQDVLFLYSTLILNNSLALK